MKHFDNLILGALVAVMGVAALFVAARTGEGVPYYAALGFFVFAVLFIFLLIKASFDEDEDRR